MQVTRANTAETYEAPKHFAMTAMRLQGGDASDCENFLVGLSTFLPGGGAEWGAAPTAKVYVVIEGAVPIKTETAEIELEALDSCYLAPNEARSIVNKRHRPATMVVVSSNT